MISHRLAIAAAAYCLLLPLAAHAQENTVPAWLLPVPVPPGTNPAVTAEPRNDWLAHFVHNVERAKKTDVELVFDGDSITDGWQGAGKEVWAKHYDRLKATDFGISADRTEHLLWRLAHGQLDGLHPKMVVLLIGTNNIGLSEEQIAEGVTAVVRAYKTHCPNAVILLQAIFPRSEKPTDPVRDKIKHVNAMLAKLGDGQKVVYLDFGDQFLSPDGTLSHDIMPDFLHPSGKGYEIWAAAIQPEIEKVFGRQTQP